MNIKNAVNIMIEFDILLSIDLEVLKKEWDILIAAEKKIYLWSKTITPEAMCLWCKENKVFDYIWDYIPKDSVNYSKADCVIDIDEKFVDRFKARGIPGNTIKVEKRKHLPATTKKDTRLL